MYWEVLTKENSKARLAFHSIFVCWVLKEHEHLKALKYSRASFALILPMGITTRKLFQHRLESDQTCMITLCLTLPSCLIILNMMLSVTCDARHSWRKMLKFNKRWKKFEPDGTKLNYILRNFALQDSNTSRTPYGLWFPVDCLGSFNCFSFISKQRSSRHGSQP